ncbi:MAG: electron transporter RnfC, partial [Duncaniella sp.]|nr:electron transporter RnfC [Duncaniella sp.]
MKTFSIGGVHPSENKLTAGSPIVVLPRPAEVVLPLNQHIGAPARPVVKVGDHVVRGQM